MSAARCRCSHAKSQHHEDRKGRTLCVGSCGCAVYRPVEAPTPHENFEQVMNSGAPIVDNASDRLYATGELEGDRCPGCGDRIPGDVDRCDACTAETAAVHLTRPLAGVSVGELLTPTGCNDGQARAAALVVCGHATDRADAAQLLAACGLIDTTKETP